MEDKIKKTSETEKVQIMEKIARVKNDIAVLDRDIGITEETLSTKTKEREEQKSKLKNLEKEVGINEGNVS